MLRLAVRHLLAEAELAKPVTAPAENFRELFRRHIVVVLEADLVHEWLTHLA